MNAVGIFLLARVTPKKKGGLAMRRRSWWLAVVCGVLAFSSIAVLAQVTADNSPPRVVLGDENRKAAEGLQKLSSGDEEQIRKHLNALLPKADEIRPMPLPEIPSDPPPHEGQMLDYPRVVAPPDLMVIEVLEALPGRPITGERLVRPNGTISLDFYGDVHVRGLTVKEAKAKVILHLRSFLNDEVLGLVGLDPETGGLVAIAPEDSNRVFVDITSYNSTPCYVQGEVGLAFAAALHGRRHRARRHQLRGRPDRKGRPRQYQARPTRRRPAGPRLPDRP